MEINKPETNSSSKNLPKGNALVRGSERYSNLYVIRGLLQAIPIGGGTLDTWLAGPGEEWRGKRIEAVLEQVARLVALFPDQEALAGSEPPEQLYDLVMMILDRAARTRSEQKLLYLANLLAGQIVNPQSWNEAEDAARLLSDLNEYHLRILHEVTTTGASYQGEEPGLRVVAIDEHGNRFPGPTATFLNDLFPEIPVFALHLYCSELVASGLLNDIGAGKGMYPPKSFAATDLTIWFMRKIVDTGQI